MNDRDRVRHYLETAPRPRFNIIRGTRVEVKKPAFMLIPSIFVLAVAGACAIFNLIRFFTEG